MIHRDAIGGEGQPGRPEEGEFKSVVLMNYLRGQFQDAYTKENQEDLRGERSTHGSFYQRVPLPTDDQIPNGSTRIVMKPPHPRDEPGYFSEVFAVYTRGEDGHEVADTSGVFADQYIYRSYTNGQPGPLWLIDEAGVHYMSAQSRFDPIDGFAPTDFTDDVEEDYNRAEEVLEVIATYNIVAVDE